MRSLAIVVLAVAAACVGGCTTIGSTPATAPVTTAPASTTSTTSSDVVSTTMTEPTTTTLDRLTEVTAIFTDLEQRRLEAIAAGDLEAYQSVFSNQEYMERSLEAFDLVEVLDADGFTTAVVDVIADSDVCLAAIVRSDLSGAIAGGGESTSTYVLETTAQGWGYSWIGEGWQCDGPHPFSS